MYMCIVDIYICLFVYSLVYFLNPLLRITSALRLPRKLIGDGENFELLRPRMNWDPLLRRVPVWSTNVDADVGRDSTPHFRYWISDSRNWISDIQVLEMDMDIDVDVDTDIAIAIETKIEIKLELEMET